MRSKVTHTQRIECSSPDIVDALSGLTALLLADDPLGTVLARVGELAANDLPCVQSCGITSTISGRKSTIVATDEQARLLDQSQYEAHEGPSLEALDTGMVITIPDTRDDTRYPNFSQLAAAAGVLCVLALPLIVEKETIGVLNLYGNTQHEFDDEELRVGRRFAAQAALVLTVIARYTDQLELTGHLQAALLSRKTIDQALGVMMAVHGCTPSKAFEHLRTESQQRNVKLRIVAAEMLVAVRRSTSSPDQVTEPT